jgi:hypothetical protein
MMIVDATAVNAHIDIPYARQKNTISGYLTELFRGSSRFTSTVIVCQIAFIDPPSLILGKG